MNNTSIDGARMIHNKISSGDLRINPGRIVLSGPTALADWEGEEARQRRKARQGHRGLIAAVLRFLGWKPRPARTFITGTSLAGVESIHLGGARMHIEGDAITSGSIRSLSHP